MGSLKQAKTFGGIGAILLLVGTLITFSFGPVLSLVGLILVFLGVKEISEVLNNKQIKDDFVKSIIYAIIAFVIIIVGTAAVLAPKIQELMDNTEDPLSVFESSDIAILAFVLVIFVIFYVIHAFYMKKSFDVIAQGTKIDYFKTGALIYLIGAFLLIIFIGVIVLIIALIFYIIGFFSLPENLKSGSGQPDAK